MTPGKTHSCTDSFKSFLRSLRFRNKLIPVYPETAGKTTKLICKRKLKNCKWLNKSALQFYFRPHYCSFLQVSCQIELVCYIFYNPQCLFKGFTLEASEFVQIQNSTQTQAKVIEKIQGWRMFQRNVFCLFVLAVPQKTPFSNLPDIKIRRNELLKNVTRPFTWKHGQTQAAWVNSWY